MSIEVNMVVHLCCPECTKQVLIIEPKFTWYGRCPDNCTMMHRCDGDDFYLIFTCPHCGFKDDIKMNEYMG